MSRGRYHIVVALLRKGDRVLLVQQQGQDDPVPLWLLPGGAVEEGELLTEALVREIREETGLSVLRVGRLAYVVQLDHPVDGHQSFVFAFEVDRWEGTLRPADPDGLVLAAEFVAPSEAVRRLRDLPWPVVREPVIACLRGEMAPGAMWMYRRRADGSQELVAQLPGPGPL